MAKIYYHAVPADWRKAQTYKFLDAHESVSKIPWTEITPDAKHNWLTEGMQEEFDGFISIGNKEAKASKKSDIEALFKTYGRGIATGRDAWVYNFDAQKVAASVKQTAKFYNQQLAASNQEQNKIPIDAFVAHDDRRISWSESLKARFASGREIRPDGARIRVSLYRPFVNEFLYFDRDLNERVYIFPSIFPGSQSENENVTITISDQGWRSPFSSLASSRLVDLHLCATSDAFQSFPFYTYNEDGTNRRENITDWALEQFRERYASLQKPARSKGMSVCDEDALTIVRASATDDAAGELTKWDIFHYTYAILHHPEYREKYAANLKRELPRIPFAPDFWAFANAGKELADIHVNYEEQPEFKLEMIENGKLALDWRVEKMRYNKEKTAIVYNQFLTIGGIPAEVHDYRLGNRSALDWIVDQYKVSTDKRSGITNDPNRDDDAQYIVRLIKKIVTVSLRTNGIVASLPALAKE